MPPFKFPLLAGATALLLSLAPLVAQAAAQPLAELNPFKLDIAVEDGRARLSGRVESAVQKELAERVALSIDGIEKVDNRIEVDEGTAEGEPPTLVQRLEDATLTATVKSKLLWNSNTRGLDIQVESQDGAVTLSGRAQTPAAKELAGQLASNTDGVRELFNHLSVSTADSSASEIEVAAEEAREAISDGWITSKVKASFVYSRNLDALNLDVETKDGFVSLRGSVLSAAEKRLAVDIARNIRGVRGVDADALLISD